MPNVLLFYILFAFLFATHFILYVESKVFEQSPVRDLRAGQESGVPEEFMIVLDSISVYERNGDGSDYNIRPVFKLYSPNRPKYSGLGIKPEDTTIVNVDWIVDDIPFKNLANGEGMSWEQYPYTFNTGISFANPRIKDLEKKNIALSISMVHTDHVKRPDEQGKSEPLFRSAVSLLIHFRLGYLNPPTTGTHAIYNMSAMTYTFSSTEGNTIDAKIDIDSHGKNDLTRVRNFHADFKGFDVSDERQRTIHLRNPDEDQSYLSIYDKQIENGESGKGTRTASAKFTLNSTVASKYRGVLKTGFSYNNYYSDVKVTFDATNLLTQPEQSRFGLFGQPVGSFFKFLNNGFNFTWSPNRPGIIPCFAVGYPLRKLELHKITGGRTVQMNELTDYRTSFDTKYEKLSLFTIPKPKESDAARYVCYSYVNISDTGYSTFHQEYDITWVEN